MSRWAKIERQVHYDANFCNLSWDAKGLWFMLMTHPNQTAIGAMRGTTEGLEAEAGLPSGSLSDAMAELTAYRSDGEPGFVIYDPDFAYLELPRFLKYNKPNSVNTMKSWVGCLEFIPESPYKYHLWQRVIAFAKTLDKAYRKAFACQTDGKELVKRTLIADSRLPITDDSSAPPPTPLKGGVPPGLILEKASEKQGPTVRLEYVSEGSTLHGPFRPGDAEKFADRAGDLQHDLEGMEPHAATCRNPPKPAATGKKGRKRPQKARKPLPFDVLEWWNKLAGAHGLEVLETFDAADAKKVSTRYAEFPDFFEVIERQLPKLKDFAKDGWLTLEWISRGPVNFKKLRSKTALVHPEGGAKPAAGRKTPAQHIAERLAAADAPKWLKKRDGTEKEREAYRIKVKNARMSIKAGCVMVSGKGPVPPDYPRALLDALGESHT